MNPLEIFDFISRGGVAGVLGYVFWQLMKGSLRLGREVTDKEEQLVRMRADRDRWQSMTFETLKLGERVTSIAENGRDK